MQAAFDYAIDYVHERKQFGRAIGTFQLMQGELPIVFSHFTEGMIADVLPVLVRQNCGYVYKDQCEQVVCLFRRTRL